MSHSVMISSMNKIKMEDTKFIELSIQNILITIAI